MSESVKKLISKNFKVSENLVTVISGFYDADVFHPGGKDAHLVKEYGLDKKFVILFVGRVSTLKGVPYLIEAVKELKGVKVLLVGREVEHENFRSLVKQLGLEDSVIFVGYKKHRELPRFYRTCDCLALPSLSEGFALVVAEAMACGKPVIASNAPPLPEVVGDAGIVVPQRNVEKLREAIETMMHSERREAYSKNALTRVNVFEKEKIMEQYKNFFKGLV